MAKKLVVRRDLHKRRRRGGAPYLKYLVFAALALLFLVVVTPYLLKNKSRETAEKRPLPNRGAVTKQLPKMAQQQPLPVNPAVPVTGTAKPGAVKSTLPAASTPPETPGSVKPLPAQVAPKPAEKAPASAKEAPPAGAKTGLPAAAPGKASTPAQPPQAAHKPLFPAHPKVSTPVHTTETPRAAPKVLFPKKAGRSNGFATESQRARTMSMKEAPAGKETAARSHRAKTAFSAKPANNPGIGQGAGHAFQPSMNGGYAVEVGSIFRTFGQAQALQKKMAAKGYRTSIHRVARLGYLVVTSPGTRSKAYTLVTQMNAEGLTNAKVVPVDSHAR